MESSDKLPHSIELFPPAYLKMYEITGQEEIGQHSFGRYIKDKEQDADIEKLAENEPISFSTNRFLGVEEGERASLIRKDIKSHNVTRQRAAAQLIWMAPDEERSSLIKECFGSDDFDVRKTAVRMIRSVSPREEQCTLVELAMENADFEIQKAAAKFFWVVPDEKKVSLVKKALKMTEQDELSQEISFLIEKGLKSEDPEVLEMSLQMINLATKKITTLVKLGLESTNPKIQRLAASKINFVPSEEMLSLINQGLKNSDIEVKRKAALSLTPSSEEVAAIAKEFLESSEIKIQEIGVGMIENAPTEERPALLNLAITKGLGKALIKPSLYKDKDIDDHTFSRQPFEKTGSEATLIGGVLKDRLIIKHFGPKEFIIWQKLYENYEVWRKAGFDYIPIEPIQSYRLTEDGVIDVYAGVLDLNLEDWFAKSGMFFETLSEQKKSIMNVLRELGIAHGHPFDHNFCLRFFRDENGEPDFNRTPRLYLIDFDEAVS